MLALGTQVAGLVFLEVVAIDDDRRRGLFFLAFLLLLRIFVRDDQCELLAVRRPRVVDDFAVESRERTRFAAGAIEQPDLFRLFVVAARGEESKVLADRAPAWRGVAVLGPRGARRCVV